MSFPGNSMDDTEIGRQEPKVPSNTPTATTGSTFSEDMVIDTSQFGDADAQVYLSTIAADSERAHALAATAGQGNSRSFTDAPKASRAYKPAQSFPSELANSLTQSLLNQPVPLPVQVANAPIPAAEVRSRKENLGGLADCEDTLPTVEHVEMRKVSQSSFDNMGKTNSVTSTSNSPLDQPNSAVFSSRSVSGADFGHDLTNLERFQPTRADAASPAETGDSRGGNHSGSEAGVKRTRQFTPASSKAIDDEDEPRRSSPRARHIEDESK